MTIGLTSKGLKSIVEKVVKAYEEGEHEVTLTTTSILVLLDDYRSLLESREDSGIEKE